MTSNLHAQCHAGTHTLMHVYAFMSTTLHREKERVCVCVWERERERDSVSQSYAGSLTVYFHEHHTHTHTHTHTNNTYCFTYTDTGVNLSFIMYSLHMHTILDRTARYATVSISVSIVHASCPMCQAICTVYIWQQNLLMHDKHASMQASRIFEFLFLLPF